MALAEGTQGRVVYKAYTTGIMESNSCPVRSALSWARLVARFYGAPPLAEP